MVRSGLRFAREAIGRTDVSSVGQHKADQPAVLVNRPVALKPTESLPEFWGVAMDSAHDHRRVYLHAAFLHHLLQIAIRNPMLAVPANTYQDDRNRK